MPFITLYQPDCMEDTNGNRIWVAGRIEVDEQGRVIVAPEPQAPEEQTEAAPVPPVVPVPVPQTTNGG